MTVSDRTFAVAAIALLAIGGLLGASAFLVDVGGATPDPVPFDDTIERGFTVSIEQAAAHQGVSIPRVQVFYSQFRYVVGYSGVSRAVAALQQPGHEAQFGYPLVVYVSDFAGATPSCENGTLRATAGVDWVAADDAAFVVGSSAGTPAGDVVVPFGSTAAAESFADDCGGEVIDWADVRSRSFDHQRASKVRERVDPQRERADEAVADARETIDREVSTVVGRDAPTVQAAIDAAPPNSTVLVPEGTYRANVTIRKPLTLRGQNATLDGGGNGTVVTVLADRTAVVGFHVEGVGSAKRAPGTDLNAPSEAWDARFARAYGHADAGVRVENATGVYVRNVTIETPSNGVIVFDSPGGVVEGLRVNGTADWQAGFMGISSIRSPLVLQGSTFVGGRDGVYLHRARGTVIRNNTFLDQRFGTHLMFTSGALLADNVARGQAISGLVIMTDPTANAVVGNDVRDAATGLIVAGSRTYVGRNIVVRTDRGIVAGADQSLYANNVLYGNGEGMVASTVVPSNRVVANDFVANERHATTGPGPLRVYTHGGRGNYWEGAYGLVGPNGTLTRPYSPTSPIDRRLHRTRAAATLASAPSVQGLRALRGTIPGLRSASVVDLAPLARPANPGLLATARNGTASDRTGGEP